MVNIAKLCPHLNNRTNVKREHPQTQPMALSVDYTSARPEFRSAHTDPNISFVNPCQEMMRSTRTAHNAIPIQSICMIKIKRGGDAVDVDVDLVACEAPEDLGEAHEDLVVEGYEAVEVRDGAEDQLVALRVVVGVGVGLVAVDCASFDLGNRYPSLEYCIKTIRVGKVKAKKV
ncbi:hypothetical protein Ddye_021831 [Dipteronia dyeriana]|uniref:Uncharacterized protein n=1 Tax=Dipteronia dyeriana TaxID=168575 RepID=A0AAD9WX88_9ROSI|nr:hypothetical protein Ddye_021831 [Dipteronia dyeriana]